MFAGDRMIRTRTRPLTSAFLEKAKLLACPLGTLLPAELTLGRSRGGLALKADEPAVGGRTRDGDDGERAEECEGKERADS